MNSHDIARLLLAMPAAELAIQAAPGVTDHLQGIDAIRRGTYPQPSWEDNAGEETPVIVLLGSEGTINENEEYDEREQIL